MKLVAFQTCVDGKGSESSSYNYFNNVIQLLQPGFKLASSRGVAQWYILSLCTVLNDFINCSALECFFVFARIVKLWKEDLGKVNKKAADSLADPSEYENLFPEFQEALLAEQVRL